MTKFVIAYSTKTYICITLILTQWKMKATFWFRHQPLEPSFHAGKVMNIQHGTLRLSCPDIPPAYSCDVGIRLPKLSQLGILEVRSLGNSYMNCGHVSTDALLSKFESRWLDCLLGVQTISVCIVCTYIIFVGQHLFL